MAWGFALSLAFHLGVLAWAVLTIQSTPELPLPETPVIEATLVTVSEVTRLKQGDPEAKILEAKQKDAPAPDKQVKEAPKPKPVAAQPPPPAPDTTPPEPPKPPEPVKPEPPKADPIADKLAALPPEKAPPPAPEPTPGPTPDEQKKLMEKLEQDRVAEEKRKADEAARKKAEELKKKKEQEKKLAEARKKAEDAKKKQFDANKLTALLNKIPDSAGAPAPASPAPTTPTTKTGPTVGEREGKDTVLTAREADLLKGMISARLRDCWRLPAGGGSTEVPVVTIKWRLRQDGTLDGSPHVERPQNSPLFQAAADAALRAVACAVPFQLPPDKYAAWKEIQWDFDPRQML